MALPEASSWMDRFLAAFFERRPVDATYVGISGHDHRLPDLSAAAVAATIAEMETLLAESEAEPTPCGFVERTDRQLAQGFLRIAVWELSSRWMIGNPSFVVGEAVFGMMSLLQSLHQAQTRPARIAALRSRMLAVPTYLRIAAETHLDARSVPIAWVEKARTECSAALSFLSEGVQCLPEDLSMEAAVAATAFEEYDAALQRVLEQGAQEFVGCGTVAFEQYMQEGHCLGMTSDEIVAHARQELEATRAWMDESEPAGGTTDLAALHPSVDHYLNRYGEVWDQIKALVEKNQLLTWPDFPIEYEPYPDWSRSSVGRLYFLHYRTPKVFSPPTVHKYMVTPIDHLMGERQCLELLAANNDYVIKTNHVVHHGGRIAHIDVASRIAFFCGGTMAEGWACYATDLIAETGGMTDMERLAHRRSRMRMCARAIVDVELHNRRMTLTDAAEFYQTSGMEPSAARGEALKNSMFPGAAMMYLIGTDLIHKLRTDLATAYGERFSLRQFHDAFLSYGSIPVKLISAEMRRRASKGMPLAAHVQSSAL